jgi:hypothetical protein
VFSATLVSGVYLSGSLRSVYDSKCQGGGPVSPDRRKQFSVIRLSPNLQMYIFAKISFHARGSVVDRDTMLQDGRSRDRVPMRWIFFSIYLTLQVALWPSGRFSF